jgi:hypothetical protein
LIRQYVRYLTIAAITILVTTTLIVGGVRIVNHAHSPRTEHSVEWHRMHVDVGPDFALVNTDTLLRATRRLSTNPLSADLLVFRWNASGFAQSFDKATHECANDSRCNVESDSVAGKVYDCMIYKHGSLADNSLTSTSICIVPKAHIESFYRCVNLACERFRSTVESSFASLRPIARGFDAGGDTNSSLSMNATTRTRPRFFQIIVASHEF